MAEAFRESCACGAEFIYAGGFLSPTAIARFREAHAACREAFVRSLKEVKTCEPSPGVSVTHAGQGPSRPDNQRR